mmetsp:Transcript_8523/g.14636  ORF Transcript_8523/g.14636 Transcript_8523/m.14636 type:complete len:85 (-) Transcript_8523:323-577(-)
MACKMFFNRFIHSITDDPEQMFQKLSSRAANAGCDWTLVAGVTCASAQGPTVPAGSGLVTCLADKFRQATASRNKAGEYQCTSV